MELLGDIGGFNSAIIIFPSFFLSFYSSLMFHQTVGEELPTRKTNQKEAESGHPASFTLQDKLKEGVPIDALT